MKYIYKPIRELFIESMSNIKEFNTFVDLYNYVCNTLGDSFDESHLELSFYCIDDRIYHGCKLFMFTYDNRALCYAYYII